MERYVRLAAADAGANGGILILLDADDECPVGLAEEILRRALTERGDLRIRVVLAKTEYESWFLAAGVLGNPPAAEAEPPFDPEAIRNAKGKLSALLPDGRSYRPTIHQVRLTATLDLDTARSAPSFDKLWRDVVALLASPEARSTE